MYPKPYSIYSSGTIHIEYGPDIHWGMWLLICPGDGSRTVPTKLGNESLMSHLVQRHVLSKPKHLNPKLMRLPWDPKIRLVTKKTR